MNISKILEERENTCGDFKGHANISQSIKSIMRTTDGWYGLSQYQSEALEMIAHKIARILNGDPNYIDSWRDIAGYAQIVINELKETDASSDTVTTKITREEGEWS